jgi:hypothetical protein
MKSTSYEAPHYSAIYPILSLVGPDILFSTLLSNTLNLCSSLKALTAEPEIISAGFKCPQCYAQLNMIT